MKLVGREVFSGRALRVELEGGKIGAVDEIAGRPELPYLSPGLIDLQVNGYRGRDYSSSDFVEEDLTAMVASLAPSGTTTHLPTIITAPEERIERNLRLLSRARRASRELEEAIPGYHIEGPYISPEDGARGAHDRAFVRGADYEEFLRWQEAAEGAIRIVTLAPEVPGALEFIERIVRDGVIAAIGHTGAEPERIREAIHAGATVSTHLGNGSHATVPRLSNYLWEQLAADELTAGVISDGYHLPHAVLRTFVRAKGLERLFLVSDVAVHGGREPGVYRWGENMVEVFSDGHLGLHGTTFLAGAGHLLDRDVVQIMHASGIALREAVALCTVNPARLVGLPDRRDFCRPGAQADLTLFDYDGGADRLTVRRTIQAGRELYRREEAR